MHEHLNVETARPSITVRGQTLLVERHRAIVGWLPAMPRFTHGYDLLAICLRCLAFVTHGDARASRRSAALPRHSFARHRSRLLGATRRVVTIQPRHRSRSRSRYK